MLTVHLRKHDEYIGEASVGNPHLLAVQRESSIREPGGARRSPEGVGSRAGLAERIRADQFSRNQLGEVSGLLIGCPEIENWTDREVPLRAKCCAERSASGGVAADDEGSGLIESHAAEFFRCIHAEQSKLARPLKQPAGKRPVLLLEAIDCRDDFLFRELTRCSSDERARRRAAPCQN